MSIILPNGARIFCTTIEGIEAIGEAVSKREPIIARCEGSGIVTETVLWHPDGPALQACDPYELGTLRPGPVDLVGLSSRKRFGWLRRLISRGAHKPH